MKVGRVHGIYIEIESTKKLLEEAKKVQSDNFHEITFAIEDKIYHTTFKKLIEFLNK